MLEERLVNILRQNFLFLCFLYVLMGSSFFFTGASDSYASIELISILFIIFFNQKLLGNLLREKMMKTREERQWLASLLTDRQVQKMNQQISLEAVAALVKLIDCRDRSTGRHSERVCSLALMLGRRLQLSDIDLTDLAIAASLHDIGKIGIPENILQKKDSLTEAEFAIIKKHPQIGCNAIKDIAAFRKVAQYVCFHHEAVDGSGYPCHLIGDEIPLPAKILSVVDVYEALTADRVYRRAMSSEAALQLMTKERGKKFDPIVLDTFFLCLSEEDFFREQIVYK